MYKMYINCYKSFHPVQPFYTRKRSGLNVKGLMGAKNLQNELLAHNNYSLGSVFLFSCIQPPKKNERMLQVCISFFSL